MAESKNLMGLNLSVDSDLVAEAAREAIVASIASAMGQKEQIVQEFVKSMLTERVRVEDGSKPNGYSNEKTCSRMEYALRKAIMEETRNEITAMIEEQRPMLRELVRKEFLKKQTQSKFVEMFLDSLSGTMSNGYNTKIDVSFEKRERY